MFVRTANFKNEKKRIFKIKSVFQLAVYNKLKCMLYYCTKIPKTKLTICMQTTK